MKVEYKCDYCGRADFLKRKDCLAHEKVCTKNPKNAPKKYPVVVVEMALQFAGGVDISYDCQIRTSVHMREEWDYPDTDTLVNARYSDGWLELLGITECHANKDELSAAVERCRQGIKDVLQTSMANMDSVEVDMKILRKQMKENKMA